MTITASLGSDGGYAASASESTTVQAPVDPTCVRRLDLTSGITVTADCLQQDGDPNRLVTRDRIRVNGVQVAPVADHTLVVQQDDGRITTDAAVVSIGAFTPCASCNRLPDQTWSVNSPAMPLDWAPATTSFEYDAVKPPVLQGLPITGTVKLEPIVAGGKNTFSAKLQVGLPKLLGNASAAATLLSDSDQGVHLDGFEVRAGEVPFGTFTLRDLWLQYSASSDLIGGQATVVLPTPSASSITGSLGLQHGRFLWAKGGVGGLNAPLTPGIFLQRITFEIRTNEAQDHWKLAGEGELSVGPEVLGKSAVSVAGGVSYEWASRGFSPSPES